MKEQARPAILQAMQTGLFERARAFRAANTRRIDSWDDFVAFFSGDEGGFALAHWSGDPAVEEKVKDMKVTIRCIPLDEDDEAGSCIASGKPSARRVVFARAY